MNLAIKGHPTRGSEVITLLEMLGGENCRGAFGNNKETYYFIDKENAICLDFTLDENNNYIIFTLEEFEAKFPYKVGNKVTYDGWNCTVIGMEWENNTNTILYTVKGIDFSKCAYVEDLQPYKEEKSIPPYMDYDITVTKEQAMKNTRVIINDNGDKVSLVTLTSETTEIEVCKNYEIKEVNGKYYAVKKKPKYPKTYEECCEILGICADDCFSAGYKCPLLTVFQELLICRDAYWKIAGEQMGLGKPWEPTYMAGVVNTYHTIYMFNSQLFCAGTSHRHAILSFPTEEIRDAFYENFKDLIESCKEFL